MTSSRSAGHAPPPDRLRCPTCGAPRRETVCHRCQSDFTALLRIERRADALHRRALECYAQGWYRRAAELADEAAALEATPDNLKLAACAHLVSGNFPRAWHVAGRL